MRLLLLIFAVAQAVNGSTIYAIVETLADLKDDIEDLIEANPHPEINRDLPLIAGSVRLAFHDCVGSGGCDGCINHALADNGGLSTYTDLLDPLYETYSTRITRADFYQYAAEVALTMATKDKDGPRDLIAETGEKYTGLDNFKVGRPDCSSSPAEDDTNEAFPLATDGHSKTMQFFADEFGFDEEESVAILGAHTLGRCHFANSGFHGPWDGGRFSTVSRSGTDTPKPLKETSILDNAYYHMFITQVVWNQVTLTNGKKQWHQPAHDDQLPDTSTDAGATAILLNADLAASWDVEPADAQGTVDCDLRRRTHKRNGDEIEGTCQHAEPAHTYSSAFAGNNKLWLRKFETTFKKMSEKSDGILQTPVNAAQDEVVSERSINDILEDVYEDMEEVKKLIN